IPKIHSNGNVSLEVEQEISNVANSGTTLTPTVQQRKVKSSIAVASGQNVLLAGLISERKEADRSGIPVLDQIPKLSDIFSHQYKSFARNEIIMFIRPQIIRDGVDAHFIAEELRTKMRGPIGATAPTVPRESKVRQP